MLTCVIGQLNSPIIERGSYFLSKSSRVFVESLKKARHCFRFWETEGKKRSSSSWIWCLPKSGGNQVAIRGVVEVDPLGPLVPMDINRNCWFPTGDEEGQECGGECPLVCTEWHSSLATTTLLQDFCHLDSTTGILVWIHFCGKRGLSVTVLSHRSPLFICEHIKTFL